MSSGKITRFQNNVRIDGYLDLSNSTAGYITIPSLSSAPSTPAVGMQYYDTTLGLIRMYQASGWSNINGTAAGSLDAAYNGGATVTVDAGAVTLNDSQTTTGGAILITKSGIVTGANNASIFHINSTGAHDTSGALKALEISVGAETISGGVYGIEIEMNANDDYGIAVTKGAVVLTDGALTLTSGNFTMDSGNASITGTLTVSGTSTLAAINNSGAITSEGAVTIDADNANVFKVRRNGTGTTLFNIDSTSDAGDTQFTLTSETTTGIGALFTVATTTGTGLSIDASTVTTGDALKIKVISGTMEATGSAISVVDDSTEVFAVRDDGSIYSKATAEGTTALQLVTGDLVITDGDLTLSGGEVSITDGVTTTGSGLLLTSTVTTSAGAFKVVGNALTSGTLALLSTSGTVTGVVLDISAAGLTTGKALDISDLDAITTGKAIHVDATGVTQTSGILVHVDSASTAITGAGRLFLSAHTGNAGVSATLNEFSSAATDETVILKVTASGALALGTLLAVSGASLTTGSAITASDLNALTTGIGLHIASSATAITTTGRLVYVNHTGATGTSATLNEFATAATDETVLLKLTATGALALGKMLSISGAAVTTGSAISAVDLDALTTGIGLHLASAATAITTTGRLFYSNHTGATGTTATLNEFASAANDETVIVKITASAANATGYGLQVSTATTTGYGIGIVANALTDGFGLSIASSATATTATGRLFKVTHSGATSTSGIIAEIASAANDETTVLRVTTSDVLALGTVLDLVGTAVTTGTILDMGGLDALTTGKAINIVSNSADATARALVYVKNDHASAASTTILDLVNDAPLGAIRTTVAATTTNFFKVGIFNGVTLWVGNGNTANAALAATTGDILFNGGSNKPEYCTNGAGSAWTALV